MVLFLGPLALHFFGESLASKIARQQGKYRQEQVASFIKNELGHPDLVGWTFHDAGDTEGASSCFVRAMDVRGNQIWLARARDYADDLEILVLFSQKGWVRLAFGAQRETPGFVERVAAVLQETIWPHEKVRPGQIDAVSGATVTWRAVNRALGSCALFHRTRGAARSTLQRLLPGFG